MAKTPVEIGSLAREACPQAIHVLRGIMNSEQASDAARIQASNSILDRGMGKPAQTILGDPNQPLMVVGTLDMLELARHAAFLLDLANREMPRLEVLDVPVTVAESST